MNRIAVIAAITAIAIAGACGNDLELESTLLQSVVTCHDPIELDRVDAFLACASDTDCPCGSRCELGACTYDCRNDAQCPSGQICDERGRCATGSSPDAGVIVTQGEVVISPLTFELAQPLPAGMPVRQTLRLTAELAAVPEVRLAVPRGAIVTCDLTQSLPAGTSCSCAAIPLADRTELDPASECFTTNLVVGGPPRRLLVERDTSVPLPSVGPTAWSIDLYAGSQRIEIPVHLVDLTVPTLPTLGHYEGRATATGGLAIAGEGVAITADVVPLAGFPTGNYRIVVSDPSRLLGPDGVLFGSINCQNPPPGFGACAWTVLGAETTAPTTPTVVRSGRTTPVARGNGTLDGDMEAFISGSLPGLAVRWTIGLRRTGDAPTVPTYSTQPIPAAQALSGQAQIRALFGPASTLIGAALWNRMEQWDDALPTQSMYQCEWDSAQSSNQILCDWGQLATIERKQAVAEARHQQVMTELRNLQQEMTCFNDAEQHLVGMRTAQQEIAQAMTERARTLVQLANLKDQVRIAVRDGRAAIDREDTTEIPKFAQESWLSGSIDDYLRKMRWARRVTYLALRAVEYEAQLTLTTEREQILRALHPDQLEATRNAIHTQVLTRDVHGRRPEEFVMRVSLCEQLDSSSAASHCDVDAFRRRLTDPGNAAYDDAGNWTGQWITFALRPFDQYASRCAERVWLVAALILSDGNANIGTTTNATLRLEKRNTFSSQWCGVATHPDPFQFSARRPCRNLFVEVGPISSNTPDATCNASSVTPADMVETYFDNSIHPGFGTSPSHPGTQELAGTGVWGDYALFIPRAVIESHVALDHVSDILLHVDYVSIAN